MSTITHCSISFKSFISLVKHLDIHSVCVCVGLGLGKVWVRFYNIHTLSITHQIR
jgi:hypothetical protein